MPPCPATPPSSLRAQWSPRIQNNDSSNSTDVYLCDAQRPCKALACPGIGFKIICILFIISNTMQIILNCTVWKAMPGESSHIQQVFKSVLSIESSPQRSSHGLREPTVHKGCAACYNTGLVYPSAFKLVPLTLPLYTQNSTVTQSICH